MQHEFYEDVTDETLEAFGELEVEVEPIAEPEEPVVEDVAPDVDPAPVESEVLTGVVLQRYPVTAYNKYSHVLVYDRGDCLVQTHCADYDGSGYFEAE